MESSLSVVALTLLATFLVVGVAAGLQALTGFGFSLLTVPLLAAATDPRTSVVGSSIVALLLASLTAVQDRRAIRWRTAGGTLTAALIGMPIGLVALTRLPTRWLLVTIAVIVLVFAIMEWRGLRLSGGPATLAVVGVACGALTTSVGMNGPPLVVAFQTMGYGPREFRATLAAVFGLVGLLGVVGFVATGLVTPSVGLVALAGAPAALIGWRAGNRVFRRMSAEQFRPLVRGALITSSVLTLVTAVL